MATKKELKAAAGKHFEDQFNAKVIRLDLDGGPNEHVNEKDLYDELKKHSGKELADAWLSSRKWGKKLGRGGASEH